MKPKRINTYTKEEFDDLCKQSKNIGQLAELMNYAKNAGGAYASIKKYLQIHQSDTSHWNSGNWNAWNKGKQLKDWSQYNKCTSLKRHLIKDKSNTCENCLLSKWLDRAIPLEVHHIDGDRTNNLYENLQLLCPNCHALTDTYRGKNINRDGEIRTRT